MKRNRHTQDKKTPIYLDNDIRRHISSKLPPSNKTRMRRVTIANRNISTLTRSDLELLRKIKQILNPENNMTNNIAQGIINHIYNTNNKHNNVLDAFRHLKKIEGPWKLTKLYNTKNQSILVNNSARLSPRNIQHFTTGIACGALPQLTTIILFDKNIGDEHINVLSEGLVMGGLPSLKTLNLGKNNIKDSGAIALANVINPVTRGGKGAMANLKELYLSYNEIGDIGIPTLVQAMTPTPGGGGALPQLTRLDLYSNNIGPPGIASLADAIASGALPSLKALTVSIYVKTPQLRAACNQRGIRLI